MSDLFVPDGKLRAPASFIPGRKSVVPMRINNRHPLAPDTYAFYPQAFAGDLILGGLTASGSNATSIVSTPYGQAIDFDNTAGDTTSASAHIVYPRPVGTASQGYVLITFIPDEITTNACYIFAHGDYANNHRLYIYKNSANVAMRMGASSGNAGTGNPLVVGKAFTCCLTWGTNAYLYSKDGLITSTVPISGTPGSAISYTCLGQLTDGATYNGAFDGKIVSCFVGRQRQLTQWEAISLCRNPYQFLLPTGI